jgi:hypothetical protein
MEVTPQTLVAPKPMVVLAQQVELVEMAPSMV